MEAIRQKIRSEFARPFSSSTAPDAYLMKKIAVSATAFF